MLQGDLHTHTVHSDGSCTPEHVFELASRIGLHYLAITDHDHVEDFQRDEELGRSYGITPLHGVEVSAYDYQRKRRVHILCYFPVDLSAVRAICDKTTESRREAGYQMVRLVSKRFPITVEDVERTTAGSDCIFKQHIMLTLMQAGYAVEMFGGLWHELFQIGKGSCAIDCVSPDVWEVLPALREAGGICVMAHPFTYKGIDIMKELSEAGLLDGIEVWQSKTSPDQEEYLLDYAGAHHLIPTGGSDFHGMFTARPAPVGKGRTPESSIEAIFALRDRR